MACQLSWIKKVYASLLQPDACLLCLGRRSGQALPICSGCQLDLPWLIHGCCHCALPIPVGDVECAGCQQRRQPFQQVHCAWRYDFPLDMLIGSFKYASNWPAGRLLSLLLASHLEYLHQEDGLELAEVLVPVPLARKRLRQRGYNQAQMIANWLSKGLQVPVLSQAVDRIKTTKIQQGLNVHQREANVRNAFAVARPEQISGLHVALIDDVLTTGATCAALARALLAAGARRVDVYCLARTGLSGTAAADFGP